MSIKQKMMNMNKITLDLSPAEMAKRFGHTRQQSYRLYDNKNIKELCAYGEKFGFQMRLISANGDSIPITYADCAADVDSRRRKA